MPRQAARDGCRIVTRTGGPAVVQVALQPATVRRNAPATPLPGTVAGGESSCGGVLDRLARKGLRTRAEITDAAMGERAECVMLNKVPHVLEAITLLDGILRRMEGHQHKKTATLRPLAVTRSLAG